MPRNPRHAPKGAPKAGKDGLLEGRIDAGEWRTRKIYFNKNNDIRPTKGRVRQAAFNMLATRVALDGARVLDLFCGSGAYGLEALSRGAGQAVFVDRDTATVRRNIAGLTVEKARYRVVEEEVEEGFKEVWERFKEVLQGEGADIVFVDPPYHKGLAHAAWRQRAALGKAGAWWVLEVASDEDTAFDGMEDVTERRYGASKLVVGQQV